ncbi:hypothetical protein SETIT_3G085900v2 [Setaria italica]|uniref:Ubiquitin-like protease family profile domain-containing protein n=1 Tax=Setaria italica TaxID=4555 RepID=A0A368QCS6_SETIT|nr:hypothetical protein SETIT_3G085900v2 [Setaria italica]
MDSNVESPGGVDLDDRLFKKKLKYSESIVSESDNQIDCCDPLEPHPSLDLIKQSDDTAHLQNMNGIKIYYENPFVSGLLKRDGLFGINEGGNFITEIVKKYLKHEMILLPVNIEETHWYLAILNVKNCEIQEELIDHNWKNLQVTEWTIIKQSEEPIQKDRAYNMVVQHVSNTLVHAQHDFETYQLSHKMDPILTDLGLLVISLWYTGCFLLCFMLGNNRKITGETLFHAITQSLMSILSTMSVQELLGGLCDYIKSINCAETLKNVWIKNSKPYSITLTVKKLQEMINEDVPMDCDCLNLVIRKIMFDNIEIVKKTKGTCSKMQNSKEHISTPITTTVAFTILTTCQMQILMPVEFNGGFILIVLNKDIRTVYILDPTPLNPIYQYNPNARHVKKLLWIAEYLPKAMSKICPGSIWNEDISCGVFKYTNFFVVFESFLEELSGYLVSLFMSAWKDVELQLPVLKDGYELKKRIAPPVSWTS